MLISLAFKVFVVKCFGAVILFLSLMEKTLLLVFPLYAILLTKLTTYRKIRILIALNGQSKN